MRRRNLAKHSIPKLCSLSLESEIRSNETDFDACIDSESDDRRRRGRGMDEFERGLLEREETRAWDRSVKEVVVRRLVEFMKRDETQEPTQEMIKKAEKIHKLAKEVWEDEEYY